LITLPSSGDIKQTKQDPLSANAERVIEVSRNPLPKRGCGNLRTLDLWEVASGRLNDRWRFDNAAVK
jgi:hypothetical protein